MWLLKMLLPLGLLGMMSLESDETNVIAETEEGASESETDEGSSPELTDDEGSTGEVEKTPEEEKKPQEPSDEEVEKDLLTKGADIPYARFKAMIDKRNVGYKDRDTKYSALKKDLEDSKGYLDNPKVYKAILENRGLTKEKIAEEMKKAGFEQKEEIPEAELFKKMSEGVDLNTKDGWLTVQMRMAKHFANESIAPINQKLSQSEKQAHLKSQEEEARTLAKDVYKLDFGKPRQDESNPNTAIGKIWNYLEKHPNHASVGYVALLKLAMAEEGFSVAVDKGKQEEKDRLKSLKESQVEGDGYTSPKGSPTSQDSTSKVLDFANKNPKAIDDYFEK